MKTNKVIRAAQVSAEKVLMANVVACTGVITLVEKVQEISFNKAVVCRSERKRIHPEQAASELSAEHQLVCDRVQASAERVKGILSKKSISVQSN